MTLVAKCCLTQAPGFSLADELCVTCGAPPAQAQEGFGAACGPVTIVPKGLKDSREVVPGSHNPACEVISIPPELLEAVFHPISG